MKYLLLLLTFITHPMWACNIVWFSLQNPLNFIKSHVSRLVDYKQYELSLSDALQRTCFATPEQIIHILSEVSTDNSGNVSLEGLIPGNWDGTKTLCEVIYCIVRLKRPGVLIETGVARGVSSSYILKALDKNDSGHLYSIDMPMLKIGAKAEVGKFVANSLRSRWTLIIGAGTHEMKNLRGKLEKIDMFIHDSNHTYLSQLAEYQIALGWLNKGGILVSHDVVNLALLEASRQFGCDLTVIMDNNDSYIGIVIK
jgi:predicted O-methyltransferase YrrM